MKSLLWFILKSCVLVVLSSGAAAGIIALDNFDYADGSLVPNGGWERHSGNTGDLVISRGQALVQHGAPSEDANLAFAPINGDIFYGLDFSVNASAAITGSDHEFFAHLKDSGSNFAARLDVVPAFAGGDFSIGLATDSSTADSTWIADLIFGISYRAIVRYDQIINLATLWIDATRPSDSFIIGDTVSGPADTISQFALRQSDSSLNETIYIDNLIIGTTFSDVAAPFSAQVPEPNSLILLLIGLVSLGGLSIRPGTPGKFSNSHS